MEGLTSNTCSINAYPNPSPSTPIMHLRERKETANLWGHHLFNCVQRLIVLNFRIPTVWSTWRSLKVKVFFIIVCQEVYQGNSKLTTNFKTWLS